MGRMLETLKTLGTRTPGQECVCDWSLREAEEVPYIEVGAGKKVEGSPQVMAVPVGPRETPPSNLGGRETQARLPVQPPHPPTEKALADAVSARGPELTTPTPLTVAFEPWQGAAPSGRGLAPEIIAYHQPEHPITRQYADLLDKLLADRRVPSALLLCGAKGQVGATTVLLNLAVTAARAKHQTIAVDLNLGRPTLPERLGLVARAGLQEALAGQVALEDAVLKTALSGLQVLAARAADNATVAHLSSEALSWLVSWLKERHDLVLIDGPSLADSADLATLAPVCDGVFLVVPQGDTIQPYKGMAQALARQGGRLKGLIHTQFEF